MINRQHLFLVGLVVLWAVDIVAYIRFFVDCSIKKIGIYLDFTFIIFYGSKLCWQINLTEINEEYLNIKFKLKR